jgi:enoyl-CoA hydratase/carnithine racemase
MLSLNWHDGEAKVVVLTAPAKDFVPAAGDEIIGPLLKMKGDELYNFTRMTCNVVRNMRQLRKPTIAAVNDIAAGAGPVLTLALRSSAGSFDPKFVHA